LVLIGVLCLGNDRANIENVAETVIAGVGHRNQQTIKYILVPMTTLPIIR